LFVLNDDQRDLQTTTTTPQVPDESYEAEKALALPKLNLQFLTIHDYLLRNFHLFRLEATCEIREDLRDCILRCKPVRQTPENTATADIQNGGAKFLGSSRMGLPVESFEIKQVLSQSSDGLPSSSMVHDDSPSSSGH
jgi:intron-binding protein aquarius